MNKKQALKEWGAIKRGVYYPVPRTKEEVIESIKNMGKELTEIGVSLIVMADDKELVSDKHYQIAENLAAATTSVAKQLGIYLKNS